VTSLLRRPLAATASLALLSGGLVLAAAVPAHAATLSVGAGQAYATIGAAVAAAEPGDEVVVYDGTYVESLALSEGITLRGATPRGAVIDGNVALGAVATLSGLTIDGSVIVQAGGAGSTIEDNTIRNASQLIAIDAGGSSSAFTVIEGNTLQDLVVPGSGNANAIFDNGGSYVLIVGNTFINSPTVPAGSVAVNLASGASHVVIDDNDITRFENALVVLAPGSGASTDIVFTNNTVTTTTSSALYLGGNNVTDVVIAGNAISDVAGSGIVFTAGYPGDPDAWLAPGGAPLSGIVIAENEISGAAVGLRIDSLAVLAGDEAISTQANTFSELEGPAIQNDNEVAITSTDDTFNGAAVVGAVEVVVTPAAPAPAAPQLAATGSDVSGIAAGAAVLALLGVVMVAGRLRRRVA
jgi:hypothetical protein